MSETANLALPFIAAAQAQKHITHNEALQVLDALVQATVLDRDLTAPPASPADGDGYIPASGATGAWAGQDLNIAIYQSGVWTFHPPRPGWRVFIADEAIFAWWDGSAWQDLRTAIGDLQNLSLLGVNATADATNRLSLNSAAALFNHDGSDMRVKVNKNAAGDTATFLFQTGFSGRAEIGLAGDDDFHFKVSADGAAWKEAFTIDRASGAVAFSTKATGLTPDFGAGDIINTDYANARGQDLFVNGAGLLANTYNWPGVFTLDEAETPGLPASFSYAGYYPGVETSGEAIAIDPQRVYRLASYIREEDYAHLQYMGLDFFDVDGNEIQAQHHMRYFDGGVDSLTTLAAPLTPGDTTITVADATGWNNTAAQTYYNGYIIFAYKNAKGHKYDYYSRHVLHGAWPVGSVNKSTGVITLSNPFSANHGNPDDPNGAWPVGTPIANASDGSNYKYAFFSAFTVPALATWYRTEGYIGGVDRSGKNVLNNFPPGTASAKVLWLPNYSNQPGGFGSHPDSGASHKVWFSGVSIQERHDAGTEKQADGSVNLIVPRINAAGTGFDFLVNPSVLVEAV